MKTAIPVENKSQDAMISKSLGRASYYLIYDMEKDDYLFIDNTAAGSQGGAGIKAAQIIADNGASALIALQCGENAATTLKAAGIAIFQGEEGSVKRNIEKLKAEKLAPLTGFHAGFHRHGR